MVLGNHEVIRYLWLTRLRKRYHVLKQFVKNFPTICLSEGEECLNRLFMMMTNHPKHKPQPTYTEGSAQNFWCIKAGRFIQHKQLIIYLFADSSQHVNLLTSQGIVQENPKKWNTRWWFAIFLRCHPSLSFSCLANRMHSVSIQIHKRCEIKVKHLSFPHFVVGTTEALKR